MKLAPGLEIIHVRLVAPHAGAWIETPISQKLLFNLCVAPHAGAWIETQVARLHERVAKSPPTRGRGLKQPPHFRWHDDALSPPTRGRGLKLLLTWKRKNNHQVAPHAGAWIETTRAQINEWRKGSRPPRGGVD